MSLKGKIVIPLVIILTLMITFIVVYVSITTANLVGSFEEDRRDAATQAVRAYLESYERQTALAAIALGHSAELIRLVHAGNREAVWQYTYNRKGLFGVDEIIVSSGDGFTLARSHLRDSFGDDISGVPSVAAGLRGDFLTLYTPTPTAYMVMTSTSPILDQGEIIGSVVVNFVIGRDEFLDELARIFGIDATVFIQDGTSVASTLIHPVTGARAVGTVARADIVETVIGRGQHMLIDLPVFGFLPYAAYYFPLPGADGLPNGMFFIGISQSYGLDTIANQRIITIIIGVASALVAIGVMFLIIAKSLRPLSGLARTVKKVSDGNLNINVDRSRLPKDEVGALSLDILGLVDVIRAMVDDLMKMEYEYNTVGDIEYRVDLGKYQNSFREMMEGVGNIQDSAVQDIMVLLNALTEINDGKFDQQVKDLPGKKMVLPNTLRATIAHLKNISTEVNGMIDAAAVRGDLNYQIDAEKYSGDWRTIMEGLNRIAEAVDAPIIEIRDVMDQMAKGNFGADVRVTGKYQGDFLAIGKAVNSMINTLDSYLEEVSVMLAAIAEGDLTLRITRDYVGHFSALKNSLNTISQTLHKTLSDISTASDQVSSGAKQIAASAQDLANGASTQASSVQELNASLDLISQQTKQNAEDATAATDLSQKSTANATEGNAAMQQMLEAMTQIKESSNSISGIIKAIQDIAFQTNLLSLNASVEAARAGEHGKGFAVVADEVRNLAGRSQTAAADTTGLIETSIDRVEAGSGIAEATAKSLATIVQNANEVMGIINNIASASKDQVEAIAQVSGGIGQISQVVQSNSAVSEQTAAASQELNSQADMLQELVRYFKL